MLVLAELLSAETFQEHPVAAAVLVGVLIVIGGIIRSARRRAIWAFFRKLF